MSQATFISGIASVLGIDESRILIASIVPGSTVVTYELYDDPATVEGAIEETSPSTDGNIDPGAWG